MRLSSVMCLSCALFQLRCALYISSSPRDYPPHPPRGGVPFVICPPTRSMIVKDEGVCVRERDGDLCV